MLTYARLLDAADGGHDWAAAAADILLLDVGADPDAAERCWRSHLERARWTVGEGLSSVLFDAPGEWPSSAADAVPGRGGGPE
ncbi:hypothetical protein SAMN05428974_0571 [Sphingopyxis sp. YR583]|nr:hypothetical protein SAMN05428974_0571 [Sphingopyxis sp. YR583]